MIRLSSGVDIATLEINQNVPVQNSADNILERDVVGNKTDTTAGTSIMAYLKYNRVVIDQIKALSVAFTAVGSTDYTDAGGEQTIYELVAPGPTIVAGLWLDLVNITQDGKIRLYYKIDGTNYRLIEMYQFIVLTDPDGVFVAVNMGINYSLKITYQEDVDETAIRAIPYSIAYEVKA